MQVVINKLSFSIFDYNIYAVCGDGCMMEGVGSEAASLAGHLAFDNFCWIYDNNHITIEGSTKIIFTEDVATRFRSYRWNVLRLNDANDIEQINHALQYSMRLKVGPRSSSLTVILVTDHRIGRIPLPPTAHRLVQVKFALPSVPTAGLRMRSSWRQK